MTCSWDLLCSLNLRGRSDRNVPWRFGDAVRLKDIRRPLDKPRLPPEHLGAFLHEITHHLIFDTPVYAATEILQMRAWKAAARFAKAMYVDPDTAAAIIEYQMRHWVVSTLLKPLNEGLALFAQHVSYCRDLPITSKSLMWGVRLFSGNHYQPKRAELEAFNDLLQEYRSSDAQMRSKAELLVQPLACVRHGEIEGDLAAYLGLNHAFLYSLRNQNFIRMTDYFTTYAIAFFFRDKDLVDCC